LRRFLALVLVVLLASCGPVPPFAAALGVPSKLAGDLTAGSLVTRTVKKSRSLSGEWTPLTHVVELGSVPRGVSMTVYSTVYVHSLKEWFASYPAGSVEQEAVLRHERVHAIRELSTGNVWFARYGVDRAFRWEEEKAGYREEVATLVKGGRPVDPAAYARILSGPAYGPIGGRMVGYEEAYSWVSGVVLEAQGH
jgi:hypothetical protein